MIRYWHYLLMFSTESSCVVILRTMKLATGGVPALDESCRILTEKARDGRNLCACHSGKVASHHGFSLPADREKQSSPSFEALRLTRPSVGAPL
jgi:hypothetical protein